MKHSKSINQEIKINDKRYIISKTDANGVISFGNDYFIEISGYSKDELIGQPHNIIRHPDMPKIAFKLMWERINNGRNFIALVKNLAKDGRYYWVVTDFEPQIDPLTNKVISHTAFRRAAPQKAVKEIIPLYKTLIDIEKSAGVDASEAYLRRYLEENNTTYDEMIDKVIGNKGLFKIFFNTMKKLFS